LGKTCERMAASRNCLSAGHGCAHLIRSLCKIFYTTGVEVIDTNGLANGTEPVMPPKEGAYLAAFRWMGEG